MRMLFVAGMVILLLLGIPGPRGVSLGVGRAAGEESGPEGILQPLPEKVHLFPGGARVEIPVPAGEFLLCLPATFDVSSVRIRCRDGGMSLSPPDVTLLPRVGWLPSALKVLSEKVETLEAEAASLEAEAASLRQLTAALESFRPEGESALDRLVAAASLRREHGLRLLDVEAQLGRKRREVELWNGRLREHLQDGYSMVMEIRGNGGSGGGLLTAWTDQVNWTYRYTLNLETRSGNISGRLVASVAQRTGVDWDGALVLHTADPPRSVHSPRLRPLVADLVLPRQDFRAKSAAPDAAPLALMASGAPPGSVSASPVREEGMRGVDIATVGRVSGEGTPSEVFLGDFSLQGRVAIVLVPHFGREAWLLAEVEELPEAILPGEAELAVDGVESGRTTFSSHGKGQDFTVAFGTTPLVRVEREKSIGVEGKNWLGKGRLADGYELSVTNGLSSEAVVRVLDRIPTSANEAVRIDVGTMDPQPVSSDKEGLLTWELALKGGQVGKIVVHYTLTFPGDRELIFHDK